MAALQPAPDAVIACAGEVVFDPSGLDDYTMTDASLEDITAEVLVEPYDPDPAELVRMWKAGES